MPAALVPLALSALLGVWTLAWNRPGNFNIRPEPKAGGQLVTGGPYRLMRHPMYTAVLLFAVPASPLAQPWPVLGGNVKGSFSCRAPEGSSGKVHLRRRRADLGRILWMYRYSVTRIHPCPGCSAHGHRAEKPCTAMLPTGFPAAKWNNG